MEAVQIAARSHREIPWALTYNPMGILQLVVDPYTFMKKSIEHYGPVYRIRGPGGEQIVLTSPEAARMIFSLPPELSESFGQDFFAPFLGTNNILGMSGEKHKQERKMLMPHFHGQRMRAYAEVIQDVSKQRLDAIALNKPFSVQDVTQKISLEVIIRAVFGLQSQEKVDAAVKAVIGLVNNMVPGLVFFPMLRRNLLGFGPWARFQKSRAALNQLLEDEIDRRRATGDLGEDILSLMISSRYEDGAPLEQSHIRDELMTLLFAGHETTAVALAWTFYWLHKMPATLEKLQAELAGAGPNPTPEVINRLPYLDAVCNETLRLYPIVPVVMRVLKTPLQVQDFELPVGSKVVVAIGWLHFDPALYPDPYTFRPERFMERSYGPNEFLPFGGGNRRCLGAAFAQYEMKLVIAHMISQARFQLDGNPPPRFVRRNAIIGPHGGTRLIRTA